MKTKEIGEAFTIRIKREIEISLKAVEVLPRKHACTGCYFKINKIDCSNASFECRAFMRSDKKSVYFIEDKS